MFFPLLEEIFSSNKALWFSGDGRKIAYARFNDNNVEAMVVPIYGEPGTLYSQYPRANFVKYPKVSVKYTYNSVIKNYFGRCPCRQTCVLR